MADTETAFKYRKKTQKQLKEESLKWYKNLVGSTNPSASNMEIYREDGGGMKGVLGVGRLQHYTYLAKGRNDKKNLPFWDAFPLALSIDVGKDYFLTLNLHYMPLAYRQKMLEALYKNLTSKKSDAAKVQFNYGMIAGVSKMSWAQPAIKKHLFKQIKSKPILIPAKDYEKIIFLPSEDFIGADLKKVWSDYRKQLKKK